MINWSAFLEPELWYALGRMVYNSVGITIYIAFIFFSCMAFWHGYKIVIGTPESSFYFEWQQLPLKRFFQ